MSEERREVIFETVENRRDKENNLVPSKVIKAEIIKKIDGVISSVVRDATPEEAEKFKKGNEVVSNSQDIKVLKGKK